MKALAVISMQIITQLFAFLVLKITNLFDIVSRVLFGKPTGH